MSTKAQSPALDVNEGITERAIDLVFDFGDAILADPGILEGIRDGVTLVLVPDDDPELAASKIAGGLRAVQRGEDVYFRHVRRSAASR